MGRATGSLAFAAMRMTREQWDGMVEHARADAPNECCGWLRARDGVVEEVVPAANERNSPYGYSLDPATLYAAYQAEEAGAEIGVYHSHPRSPAEPSQTDINLATYPHWTYLIVSLAGEPVVRAWRIADGRVEEEEIVVDG